MSELGKVCEHGSLARSCLVCELQSQLSDVQGELDSYSSCINGHKNPKWTCIQCGAETMTKALAERDALKAENEILKKYEAVASSLNAKNDSLQKEAQRLRGALEEMYDTFPCDHVVTFKPKSCCACRAKQALSSDEGE